MKRIVKQFNPDRLKSFGEHLMASSSRIQRMFLNTFIFRPVTIIAKFSRLAEQSGISQMHALGNNQLTSETILELHGHTSETEKAGFFNCGDLSFFDRMSKTLLQDDRTSEFFESFIADTPRAAGSTDQEHISTAIRAGVEYLFPDTKAERKGETYPSAVVEYGTRSVGVGFMKIVEQIHEDSLASTSTVLIALNQLREYVITEPESPEDEDAGFEANKKLLAGKKPSEANKILEDFINQNMEALAEVNNLALISDNELYDNLPVNTLPRALALLNLKSISCSSNAKFHIPKWIGELKTLRELILSGCQITEVPEEIGALNNLRVLDLSNNQISEIPRVIFGMVGLTELRLHSNPIREIPEEIRALKNLRHLDLCNIKISEIPRTLYEMVGLVYLSLSLNQIQEVSPEIRRLTALESLSLSDNPIGDAIFQQLSELNHLTQLSLINTGLTVLPTLEQLGRLESLEYLFIDGNPMLVALEPAVLEAWGEEIYHQHPHNQIPGAQPVFIDIDPAND